MEVGGKEAIMLARVEDQLGESLDRVWWARGEGLGEVAAYGVVKGLYLGREVGIAEVAFSRS